jgi:hypothetical protein
MFFASKKESATLYMNLLSILKLDNDFKLKIATLTYKIIKMKIKISLGYLQISFLLHLLSTLILLDFLKNKILLGRKLEQIIESLLLDLFHQNFGSNSLPYKRMGTRCVHVSAKKLDSVASLNIII